MAKSSDQDVIPSPDPPRGASTRNRFRRPRVSPRSVESVWGRMVRMTARGDTADLRKARGAFFTPEPMARYIADWAIRAPGDRVLEPSCGQAAFLQAAVVRLQTLAGGDKATGALDGIELHPESAAQAAHVLRDSGVPARIRTGDFFSFAPDPMYDSVIGNPPYIRYQDFTGDARARAREAALRAGVSLSGLASSWAAFTVHSALFLRPGGRLGLVLPAELLSVNYASGVRAFLMRHFASVRLVTFAERVFPGVMEEVVLLLAEGYDPTEGAGTDSCELFQVQNAAALSESAIPRIWRPLRPEGRWMPSMLSEEAHGIYVTATGAEGFGVLEDWGDTTLGMVTGNNRYFALSSQRVRDLGLEPTDLLRLSPPGSRHLRDLSFTTRAWESMGALGSAIWLLRPEAPSKAAQRYLAHGKAVGVDQAYKCRVRKPWWRTPYLRPAHMFLTYMNADTPRITANRARVHHVNSVHGIYLREGLVQVGRELLALASLNTVTLLGAETVGRAYGGGMLKIEPKEADRLPIPVVGMVEGCGEELRRIRRRVLALLRGGRLLDAVDLVDDVLLVGALGLSAPQVKSMQEARASLAARRVGRGREASLG